MPPSSSAPAPSTRSGPRPSAPRPSSLRPSAPRPSGAFRPDIEGLRAVAVLVVVADHLIGRPSGGFVGVDVFFVISGFVITAVLLRELDATGTISLSAFYARRARRVMPAAVSVLVVTLGAAALLWLAPRFWSTVLDAVASFTFVQNWHLVAIGTDYLAADAPPSPLQHFWSLAVEEQFYLVWPIVLLGATGLATRWWSPRVRRPVVAAVLSGVLVASVAYAVWRGDTAPSAAYFDSIARMWELAAGGLCAFAVPAVQRAPLVVRRGLVVAGQGALVASLVVIHPGSAFPWPWALLPVLGASAIVVAGSGRLGLVETVLVSRPARWVGRRSYSLYLWHFPVIVFTASLGVDGVPAFVVSLSVMLALTVASFRFVEQPARRSRWLLSWEASPVGSSRFRSVARQIVVAGAVTVVVAGMSAAQIRGPVALRDPGLARAAVGLAPLQGGTGSTAPWSLETLTAEIAASTRHPDRAPRQALDAAFTSAMVSQLADGVCRYDVGTSAEAALPCEAGDDTAQRTAVLVGDSIALSWLPALEEALGDGWRIRALAFGSCSTTDARFHVGDPGAAFADACADSRAQMLALVDAAEPDLVVTSSSVSGLGRLLSGATGSAAVDEWRDGTRDAVVELARGGARVVVLGAPPRGASPAVCATRPTGAEACVTEIEAISLDARTAERDAVDDARGLGVDAEFVDVVSWFCTASGRCPVVAGDTLIRADRQHLTETMSRSLGAVLRAELDHG